MKKLLIIIAIAFSIQGFSQDLPEASPRAVVSQRVGLTDIEINYSRPSVKGREIFGGLIPHGKHWRLGANKNSTISFSTEARIGNQVIAPGKYSLTAIVDEEEWTIILNSKNDMWGIDDGYNSREDVARVTTPVVKSTNVVESLHIGIENLTQEKADLVISWDKSLVKVPIILKTIQMAEENLANALNEKPEDYKLKRTAARFYIQNNLDINAAYELMNEVIENNPESWYNNYLQAQVLEKMGMPGLAKNAARIAMKLGKQAAKEKGEKFYYQDDIKSFIQNL